MNAPTKTQKELDSLLCPDDLLERPEDPDLKPDPTGLTPDWAREKKGADEEAELPVKAKIPTETSAKVELSFSGLTLGEWLEKQTKDQTEKSENEKFEREIESRKVEDENREIKESFRRLAAKKSDDDALGYPGDVDQSE